MFFIDKAFSWVFIKPTYALEISCHTQAIRKVYHDL